VSACDERHCITCSDEGVPARVLSLDSERGLALCEDADAGRMTVDTALVEPVVVGDELLVHAGVALLRLEAAS
jgi:hydrogenase maturation factor